MAEQPTISVVIPLYNKGRYIARALNSVLSQTLQDFEIIVVDDGSTDDGATIVREFGDPRIRLIRQENQGVSAARNRGINESHAELVAFLDSDDEWLPKHLEVLFRLWKRYPEAGAYGTAYLKKLKESEDYTVPKIEGVPRKPWEGILPSYFKVASVDEPPISSSSAAIPKYILLEMGGFTTKAWWGEDTDLWGRIALKYPVAFSWDGMIIFHGEALNRASYEIKSISVNVFVISARKALQAGEVPSALRNDLIEYIAAKQIQTANRNLQAGRPDLARNNLKDCKTRNLRLSKYWTLFWTFVPFKLFILFNNLRLKIRR
jgi:glycosyltransferase involved in cell wall biosynthesis